MMTALSVARECSLIGRRERVIMASVSPPSAENEIPNIEWTEVEPVGAMVKNASMNFANDFQVWLKT